MRLVHISDVHLGFRQFQRLTAGGINQREADVATAFRRAIDRTIELNPALVLFAGDIFHAVRPPNPAILHAFAQLARISRELPEAQMVMIAGNHDTPRSTETGCILRLFRQLGVHVVDGEPAPVVLPELNLRVLAVPDIPGMRPSLDPDPAFRYNVLMLHGEVAGVVPREVTSEDRPALEIRPEELNAPAWNYVALGHYHVFREIAPNAWYSGALEYTSTNPWAELREQKERDIPGKGLIEFDLDSGECTFHPVAPSRDLIELNQFSARGMTAIEVDERIAALVDSCPGGIDDKVVRLVVRDVPRHIARELDMAAVRAYKKRALNFILDTRRPDPVRIHGQGAPGRRPSLVETVRDKLYSRPLESDMNRDDLVKLGLKYLQEAEEAAAAALEPEA